MCHIFAQRTAGVSICCARCCALFSYGQICWQHHAQPDVSWSTIVISVWEANLQVTELKDRSELLFGRAPDLDYLLKRAEQRGITAVVGRARMGKSWLLMELARRLSQGASSLQSGTIVSLNLQEGPSYLVGFKESPGESADLLLRAVMDLYARWLSDSSYWQKARIAWERQRKDLAGETAEAVGTIFKSISKLGGKPLEMVGDLVDKGLGALATATRDLKTGGARLQTLQSEQVRELLDLVAKIGDRKMVLVLDAWQNSLSIEMEANILDSFVHHLEEWPPSHIFLGILPGEKPAALASVERLCRLFPGAVEAYELPPMHLEDTTSGADLLQHLRKDVPVTQKVAVTELLEMISGYPGVVQHWTSPNLPQPRSVEELKKRAGDANANRFAEFDEELLKSLSEGEQRLGIRLVLLPATSSADDWKALRPVMLEGMKARDLDGLKRKHVLESSPPPSYGHAKRNEAALEWYLKNCYEELRQECESLIFNLASRVEGRTFASGLGALYPMALKIGLSSVPQALCQMGLYWFSTEYHPDAATLLSAAEEARKNRSDTSVARLLAMGLWSTLIDRQESLERAEALLEELRQLARAYLQDAAVRGYLAGGLSEMVRGALWFGDSGRDPKQEEDWLDELRQLANNYPQDVDVRKELAEVLYQAAMHNLGREQRDRLDGQLEELEKLAQAYPQDAVVRNKLATGLVNTLYYAEQEGDALERCDTLLEELRELARAHPGDGATRESLRIGLYNSFVEVKEKSDLPRRDALLDELRQLSRANPQDANARGALAKGLLKTLIDADEEGTPERRDALFEELRQLARAYPQDRAVSKELAMGLSTALHNAKHKGVLPRCDPLLGELRELARSYFDDELVSKTLKVVESSIGGDDAA